VIDRVLSGGLKLYTYMRMSVENRPPPRYLVHCLWLLTSNIRYSFLTYLGITMGSLLDTTFGATYIGVILSTL
jgi:hypothetical protein